jgi:hypothetical protein
LRAITDRLRGSGRGDRVRHLGGGLPFALVAAMLTRPVRINGIAAALTAIAVLVGAALMDAPIQSCIRYLSLLLGAVADRL